MALGELPVGLFPGASARYEGMFLRLFKNFIEWFFRLA